MTAKEWMKVPRALRDHAIGKCASLLEELSPRKRTAAAAAMILVLAGLCLSILLGGTEPEAGTPSMGTAIETVR